MCQVLVICLLGIMGFLVLKHAAVQSNKRQAYTFNESLHMQDSENKGNLAISELNNSHQRNHLVHYRVPIPEKPEQQNDDQRKFWRRQTHTYLEWAVGRRKDVVLINIMPVDSLGEAAMTEGLIQVLLNLGHKLLHVCLNKTCNLVHTLQIIHKNTAAVLLVRMNLQNNKDKPLLKDLLKKCVNRHVVFVIRRSSEFNMESFRDLSKKFKPNMNIFFLACDHTLQTKIIPPFHIKSAIVPDFTFSLYTTSRFMEPIYNIVWLLRDNANQTHTVCTEFPNNLQCDARSWANQNHWRHHISEDPREMVFVKAYNALFFIQRGQVVITEELDGLLVAMASGIPVIIVKNQDPELDTYWRDWKANINTTRVKTAEDQSEARTVAMEMLRDEAMLPALASFMKPIHVALQSQLSKYCVPGQ